MTNTTRRGWFIVVAVAIMAGGCTGGTLNPMPTGQGGGRMDSVNCECVVQGSTLTISWGCYCATNDCSGAGLSCHNRQVYPDCRLTTDTVNTAGGPWIRVWDSSGTLVGVQSGSDTSPYVCPSDPSLTGFTLRAGRFPDSSCETVACTCLDETAAICTPPDMPPDGGAPDARDAGPTDARDGPSNDSAPCSATGIFDCAVGEVGGWCGDQLVFPICVNGQWACPSGSVPSAQCRCVGPPPSGCTCDMSGGGRGWFCFGDGGANDGPTCTGTPSYCALGSAGGMCSDVAQPQTCVNGQWVCPGGTVLLSQCRCVGAPPPGCTCGSNGFSCPTDGGAGN